MSREPAVIGSAWRAARKYFRPANHARSRPSSQLSLISLAFLSRVEIWAATLWPVVRATHALADHDNIAPTTAPTMYMAQAERLIGVLVELNMRYSPRSATPKLP